ncbi:bifunctional (p)ppGpp synthetase/guanosine-3',5'-bis(diphosphate) 3'-pyrophosphohydrolase [Pikeienuella piscinae]|uniref:GTP pyrophosphokinase rsh n=1 Tax=Pikeienuella piscinae TaxID=2748098 RepID=A0A7L5C0V4_9RHOB|nr:bifunctional (p)ppGpp synthetase/guanosine-3',5'-bis(diphosphate) 3'-pyrophosphohydrolase [Pikeienuella piscinae]QIE56397.1 bifunctional (p)ppGpp synthetase/guanosine-3',5'-bis(diphosphate) 3'-pyrophosphohydrolase [Pikeienuella piscinae]
MIRQFELVEMVRAYNPSADEALLNRAYVYGARAHATQKRASGEPYFGHPLEVAAILTGLKLDDATIVTALLHDTIEDTEATFAEITELFGAEIAELVDGVTKLNKLELASRETEQAENFRKLLIAMSRDVRVLLVKLADRTHNMRTLNALRPEKRARIARETMDIFAPLAGRMGMQQMREELEDLAFEELNPEARTSIMRRFLKLRKETGDLIPRIKTAIEQALYEAGVSSEVEGREKKPYSIWRKMEEKQIGFGQLSDIYGFRIITRDIPACYNALGAVHTAMRVVPERMKDYISGPKSNGYRSLHTTVYGPAASRVEIQIRTREMHEVAETGVAAHWAYKEGRRSQNPFAVDPFHWLSGLVERMEKGDAPREFLEQVKLDMFHDQVFCFTPKGDVYGLPRGATPIDFAYAIHTRIGDSCVGAKVDGARVPLWTRLRNGQSVEIIRVESSRPSPVWMDMAKTGRARAAIRRALREEERDEHIRLGKEIARLAFERRKLDGGSKALQTAARKLGFAAVENLLAALGAAELSGRRLVAAVYPGILETEAAEPEDATGRPHRLVVGAPAGLEFSFATCCEPIPGERIVGIRGKRGIEAHCIDCAGLVAHEEHPERWIDLRWDEDAAQLGGRSTSIEVTLANQAGALGAIATLVGEHRANIENITTLARMPDFWRLRISLTVKDVKHMSAILSALEAQTIVTDVHRTRQPAPPLKQAEVEEPQHLSA